MRLMATRNPGSTYQFEVGSLNPIIYMVSYIPSGFLAGFLPSTVSLPMMVGDWKIPLNRSKSRPSFAKQPGYFTPISGVMGPYL